MSESIAKNKQMHFVFKGFNQKKEEEMETKMPDARKQIKTMYFFGTF